MIKRLRHSPDSWAILILIALWLLFFWRLLIASDIDAVSLEEGDFSGQFVSWTSYSVERFSDGELPLWNPYMNAGAPFLADPQTAVLYPPRILTVTLLGIGEQPSNGDVYAALQIEMTLHVLLGVLFMYVFLRRVTAELLATKDLGYAFQLHSPSIIASMIGALIFGFGGFMSGYPQLQLPLLETAIWIPLVLLGIHEATRPQNQQIGWRCIILAGIASALAVLAGHPQTYVFIGYVAVAYLIYRAWQMPTVSWGSTVIAIILFGVIVGGFSAAQWLPTLEFQSQTYREGLSFDEKGGGILIQDILQFIFPEVLGRWSPFYMGILGIILISVAIWRRIGAALFWSVVGLVAILLSLGKTSTIYHIAYLILPGFRFFRGQERAVFIVATVGAILAASGAIHILTWDFLTDHKQSRQLRRAIIALGIACGLFALIFFVLRLIPPNGELYQTALERSIFALILSITCLVMIPYLLRRPNHYWWQIAIVGLIVFDLFSINVNNANYEPISAKERLPQPAYIQTIHDNLSPGQHVEGLRGIRESYGALYRVPDIWGTSPLRLDAMDYYLWRIPIERRWELLAVQIVDSEWDSIPAEFTKIGVGEDRDGTFNIFRLDDPRPFALMMFEAQTLSDNEARELVGDLDFPIRQIVLLDQPVGDLPTRDSISVSDATVTTFDPEYIAIETNADTTSVLSLALPYVSGWQATVDGQDVDILKAYGGLSALYLDSGGHKIELRYRPMTFMIGLVISGITLLVILISFFLPRRRQSSPTLETQTND
jgi:hypothetical protein